MGLMDDVNNMRDKTDMDEKTMEMMKKRKQNGEQQDQQPQSE
ncbi:MAG TPA: hypothetical protein VK983_00650 [Candidatus Limnocylindrales bacterium]|nr:hypothetical protein [Candidatus Limnocylindrales bacterium]